MKRDVDLMRSLLTLRAGVYGDVAAGFENDFPDTPADVVTYHLTLLEQAGLVSPAPRYGHGQGRGVGALTYTGHEVLELMRRDDLWNAARDAVKEKSGGTNLELILRVIKTALTPEEG